MAATPSRAALQALQESIERLQAAVVASEAEPGNGEGKILAVRNAQEALKSSQRLLYGYKAAMRASTGTAAPSALAEEEQEVQSLNAVLTAMKEKIVLLSRSQPSTSTPRRATTGDDERPSIIASEVRPGDYIIVMDHPCRVLEISHSKSGKHGFAKVVFCAQDLTTKRKVEQVVSSSSPVLVCPDVEEREGMVMDMLPNERTLTVMMEGDDEELIEGVELPPTEDMDQLLVRFREGRTIMVLVMTVMGVSTVLGWKEEP